MTKREAFKIARDMARSLGKGWKPEVQNKFGIAPKEFYIVARRKTPIPFNSPVTVYYHTPRCYSASHPSFMRGPVFRNSPSDALDELAGAINLLLKALR
jgi:hypothetical protein